MWGTRIKDFEIQSEDLLSLLQRDRERNKLFLHLKEPVFVIKNVDYGEGSRYGRAFLISSITPFPFGRMGELRAGMVWDQGSLWDVPGEGSVPFQGHH